MSRTGAGSGSRVPGTGRTVGQPAAAVDSPAQSAAARLEAATAALAGREPMPRDEALALIARVEASPPPDAAVLSADRAEASAQLEAARALLASLEPPAPRAPMGPMAPERPATAAVAADSLRDSAQAVIDATAEVSDAQRAAARSPGVDAELIRRAEEALAVADAAREDIAPAWRRTAGALISGTGMAILVAALSWPEWVYLAPAALVSIMALDLRMAGAAARAASIRAAEALGAAGVAGREGLERARARQADREAAARRLEEARQRVAETRARWAKLAPAAEPTDVEALIARLTSEGAPPDPPPPAPVDPEAEQARALAQRLVEEAQRDLERAEQALCDLADLAHARRSLEWHDARGTVDASGNGG